MPKVKKMKRTTAEKFVKVWNACKNVSAVAKYFGKTNQYVSFRSSFLRSKGWQIKKFVGGRKPLKIKRAGR